MFSRVRIAIRFFFLGLAVGVLLAPRSGKETRAMVRERADRLLNDLLDAATLGSFEPGPAPLEEEATPSSRQRRRPQPLEAQHQQQRHQWSPGLSARTPGISGGSTAASEKARPSAFRPMRPRRWWRRTPAPRTLPGHDEAREQMVRTQIEARGLTDPALLRAFRIVPRELFVESGAPYGDNALPIEQGQTISQPYVVAFMTNAARPRTPDGWRGAKVLEIGTGSGYQAAILSELGADLTSVERHADLSQLAGEALLRAGYSDVRLVVGDGTEGFPQNAPYDVVLVTAAGPSVPLPLLEQLRPDGGRLLMPVGDRDRQWLTLVVRDQDEFHSRALEPVVFVPLVGEHGF